MKSFSIEVRISFLLIFAEYEKAIELYTAAMEICPKVAKKQLSVLFANRAACYVKMVISTALLFEFMWTQGT